MSAGAIIGAVAGLVGAYSSHRTGKRQEELAEEALTAQEKKEARVSSKAASLRLDQKAKEKALRKKKPKMSAILARRKAAAQQGIAGTFLTGPSGDSSPGLGGSYRLGD
jgi:hypothetical protein